jgi:hypothetical protein
MLGNPIFENENDITLLKNWKQERKKLNRILGNKKILKL